MEKTRNIRYQSVVITLPNGTVAGQFVQKDITLDNNYAVCTGVMFLRLSGTNQTSIGFRNPEGVVIDAVSSKGLEVNESVEVEGRFIPVHITANGRIITVQAFPTLSTNAVDQIFEVVFRLEGEIS